MVKPPRFHTKRRRRSGRRSLWRKLKPLVTFLFLLGVGALIMRMPVMFEGDYAPVETRFTLCSDRSSQGCVIDGDTIMIGQRKIRISGYNAPELAGECADETALARRSRDALLAWLDDGVFQMDGGEDPPFDKFGRELRVLKRGQEWLSDHMIKQGLAQESGWGFERGGWCDQTG